ncbi:MAG: hypothetical protein HY403_07445, partial [Elusimicrobia bacterium]|nr:hypothetical protein [Elusimicrobiota bacterium]
MNTAARTLRLTVALAIALSPFHGLGISIASAQDVPARTHFQGRLTDSSNNPLSGPNGFVFAIYDDPTAGSLLWTETQPAVSVTNGVFAVQLGAVTPLPSSLFAGSTTYLQVTVNGNVMTPRERLVTVPFAHNAQLLSGRGFSAFVSTDATTQNIAGAKTFTGSVSVPAPTAPGHAATKAYVDAAGGTNLLVATSTWSGQNTFLNLVSVSSALAVTGTVTFTASGPAQFSLQTSSGVSVGGTGGVYANFFSGSFIGNGAGLTGVTSVDGSKVAKTGDTMSGDLQIGSALASTVSASGYLTLANLGSAPGASRGRLYFDPTAAAGVGALKISLDGAGFVSLS